MTVSIFEFTDIADESGDVIWPPATRTEGATLGAYTRVSNGKSIRALLVCNDDGTTGIRVRIATASTGQDATQYDVFIAANDSRTFLIPRKDRTDASNALYVMAVADT